MPQGRSPILELQGITKSFGGVEALRGVDFALSAGEIHGLVGENGAGKSTLMKIIAGLHPEFSGRFLVDGQETRFRSARDAHAAGIAMVHQELSVAPDLTVAENVFLGHQPTNRLGIVQWRRMAREASEEVARFGNGRKVAESAAAAITKGALIEAMIGRGGEALEHSYTDDLMLPPSNDGSVVLKAEQLSLARSLRDVSFEARSGEVLGIYGFMGC